MMKDGNLRTLLKENVKGVHWVTIETGLVSPGVPDCNGCKDGIEFWVELKACKGWQVAFRVEQVGWILRRRRAGGKVFIAVRRMNAPSKADQLYLFDGIYVAQLSDHGIQKTPFIMCSNGGPATWDWPRFANKLLEP